MTKQEYQQQRLLLKKEKEAAKIRALEEMRALAEVEEEAQPQPQPQEKKIKTERNLEKFLQRENYTIIAETETSYTLKDELLNITITTTKKDLENRFKWWKRCKDWKITEEELQKTA